MKINKIILLLLAVLFVGISPPVFGKDFSKEFKSPNVGPPSCTMVSYITNDSNHRIILEELRSSDKSVKAVLNYMFRNNSGGYSINSGVIIDPRGFVLTNSHCIDSMRKRPRILVIWSFNYRSGYRHIMEAEFLARNVRKDLALLKIKHSENENDDMGFLFPTVVFGEDPVVGNEGFSISSPFGLISTGSSFNVGGIIRGSDVNDLGTRTRYKESMKILQLSGSTTNLGSSGGPLFIKCKFVGVFTSIAQGEVVESIEGDRYTNEFDGTPGDIKAWFNSGIAMAVPVSEIVPWLREVEPSICVP